MDPKHIIGSMPIDFNYTIKKNQFMAEFGSIPYDVLRDAGIYIIDDIPSALTAAIVTFGQMNANGNIYIKPSMK